MPESWERSATTRLTLAVITVCLHSAWPLLISFDAPQFCFHRRHEQLSPSVPRYFTDLSCVTPSLKYSQCTCSLHSSSCSTSLITLIAFSIFFPILVSVNEEKRGRRNCTWPSGCRCTKDAGAWQNHVFGFGLLSFFLMTLSTCFSLSFFPTVTDH